MWGAFFKWLQEFINPRASASGYMLAADDTLERYHKEYIKQLYITSSFVHNDTLSVENRMNIAHSIRVLLDIIVLYKKELMSYNHMVDYCNNLVGYNGPPEYTHKSEQPFVNINDKMTLEELQREIPLPEEIVQHDPVASELQESMSGLIKKRKK